MLDVKELLNIFANLYNGLLELGEYLTMSVRDVFVLLNEEYPSIFSVVVGFITQNTDLPLWDYSLVGLILGSGILLFVAISLVKWLLDIIT